MFFGPGKQLPENEVTRQAQSTVTGKQLLLFIEHLCEPFKPHNHAEVGTVTPTFRRRGRGLERLCHLLRVTKLVKRLGSEPRSGPRQELLTASSPHPTSLPPSPPSFLPQLQGLGGRAGYRRAERAC